MVTHAVEFLALADHIIVMDEGKVKAQGSYNELQDNVYLKKVLEIHNLNVATTV